MPVGPASLLLLFSNLDPICWGGSFGEADLLDVSFGIW